MINQDKETITEAEIQMNLIFESRNNVFFKSQKNKTGSVKGKLRFKE